MRRIAAIGLALLCAVFCQSAYQYYYADQFLNLNTNAWWQNGSVLAGSGLTSTTSGSLISKVAVPDGTSEYEASFTLKLPASGGNYVAYLRATPDAHLGPTVGAAFTPLTW